MYSGKRLRALLKQRFAESSRCLVFEWRGSHDVERVRDVERLCVGSRVRDGREGLHTTVGMRV